MAEIGNHKILQFCSFSPLGTDSSFQENGLKSLRLNCRLNKNDNIHKNKVQQIRLSDK